MSALKLDRELMREAFDAYLECDKNKTKAAQMLGLPRNTYTSRLDRALENGFGEPTESKIELPQFPDDDLSADEILDHLEATEEKRNAHAQSLNWFRIGVQQNMPIGINWFGDPHIGANDCNYKKLREDVRCVANTPQMFGANIGDTSDNWPWSGRLLKLYADMNASKSRERTLARWFLEDSGIDWLVWLEGNHDWFDPTFAIYLRTCNANRVPMVDWRARFKVEFPNGAEFKFDAAHDHKGHSQFHALHGQIKANLWSSTKNKADVYIAGHRHTWAYMMNEIESSEITHYVRCRGYKRNDDHAMHHGFNQQDCGQSMVVILDPVTELPTERIRVFADTLAGADYLTYLLRRYE
jgi:hypothetical protein